MTIFQAKGLQFPFVFVAGIGRENVTPTGTHQAETLLNRFRAGGPQTQNTEQERAVQDMARLYFVAYSRAQYSLIILSRYQDLDRGVPPLGAGGRAWLDTLGIRSLNEATQAG